MATSLYTRAAPDDTSQPVKQLHPFQQVVSYGIPPKLSYLQSCHNAEGLILVDDIS